MKKLEISQKGITKQTAGKPYYLELEVVKAYEMPAEVFLYQRFALADGKLDDTFAAVCSAAQLEDLPANAPEKDSSYFRKNKISLVSTNPEYLETVRQDVLAELGKLVDDVTLLDDYEVDVTYTITTEGGVVQETSADNSPNEACSKAFTFDDLTDTGVKALFFTDEKITISKVAAAVTGDNPGVTWSMYFGPALGSETSLTEVFFNEYASTTQELITEFADATIPANSYIWVNLSTIEDQTDTFHITVFYS